MTLVVYLLTCVAHTAVVLALLLAAIFWYFRPFRVSSHLPGPQRHWLFGTTFGDSDVFLAVENNSNKKKTEVETTFDWEQWPTLSLAISRHLDFRIWGGTTLNIGFGGAFFNVGTYIQQESWPFDAPAVVYPYHNLLNSWFFYR